MNEAYAGSFLIGMLVGLLLTGIASVLVGGLIVKVLAKAITKFSPPYQRCCLAMLLSVVATGAVYFAITAIAVAIADGGGCPPLVKRVSPDLWN